MAENNEDKDILNDSHSVSDSIESADNVSSAAVKRPAPSSIIFFTFNFVYYYFECVRIMFQPMLSASYYKIQCIQLNCSFFGCYC
jgi:hypothetical protein